MKLQIKPLGHRLLVKPDEVEQKTKSGIIVATGDSLKNEQLAVETGIVLEIGDLCWSDTGVGMPWCEVGDKIYFPKYSGQRVYPDSESSEHLLFLNDLDITGVVVDER